MKSSHFIKRHIVSTCFIALMLSVFWGTSCSNKEIYDATRENRRMECHKLPGREREQCLQEQSMSYEEYQQEREKVLQSK